MKKLIAMLLTIVLVLSMTACSGTDKEASNGTPETKTEKDTENKSDNEAKDGDEVEAVAVEPADPFGAYDGITLTTFKVIDENLKYPEDQDMNNNIWTAKYQEELGITVDHVWSVPKGESESRINIAIASNDLPDFFRVSQAQLKLLAENGQIMPLTDIFEQYASPLVKELLLEDDRGVALGQSTINGELYAVPAVREALDGSPLLWIRTDWLEKLGLEAPKTMDDLEKIAEAFMTMDPDGNGEADTLGLSGTANLNDSVGGLQGYFMGFNAYPFCPSVNDSWILDENGKIDAGTTQPEVRAGLERLAAMYDKGLLDEEFALRDANKIAELAVSDKLGLLYAEHWFQFMWPVPSHKSSNPDAEWQAFAIPTVDGSPSKVMVAGSADAFYVVNKDCENPEAVVKMLNIGQKYMNVKSADFDEELHTHVYGEDKYMVWQYAPVHGGSPSANSYGNERIALWFENKNEDYWDVEAPWIADMIDQIRKYNGWLDGNDNMWNWATDLWQHPVHGAYAVIRNEYAAQDRFMINAYISVPTPTMVEKKETLNKMTADVFTKVIMGAAEISEFDQYVKDWYDLGGSDMVVEVNAAVQ